MQRGFRLLGATGRVLVCLHSSMSSSRQFLPLAQQLAASHRLLLIDLYGYGDAPPAINDGAHSLVREVTRIQAILAELEINEFDVLGHSFGGACALTLALANPEPIGKLALFEPVAFHLLSPCHPERQRVAALAAKRSRCRNAKPPTTPRKGSNAMNRPRARAR